ncbi:MAG: PAS domain S-box protein [Ignavibacteriales bacterium]|nr:PAS domain S-box protein [Ignavibacteriales bacterium]
MQSETLMKLQIDRMPLANIVWDTEFRVRSWNPAARRIFGFTDDEAIGKLPYEIIVPRSAQQDVEEVWRRLLTGDASAHSVNENITKDGRTITCRWINTPLKTEEGEVAGVLSMAEDITESIRVEEELRRSEHRYRSLVESARDAIITITPKGIFTSLNRAFETLTGWDREEWIGKTFSDLFHPDDARAVLQFFRQALEGMTPPVQEYRLRTKSGEYLLGELTITPQREDGRIVGVLGIARDATARKSLEYQLIQAQKMESLGTLAGGIAHDFNNILGIILGQASILERCGENREMMADSVDSMTKAVQRGASLVRQILTFARKSEVVLAPVNVNTMIRELATMLEETFPKTVEFNLELDASVPVITMDHAQLHQALLNLCVNARDAINDLAPQTSAHGLLTIRTEVIPGSLLKGHADATESWYICISVSDSGKGMDETTKGRIFEPFFTTKEPGKGTGWGLAVVYGIIKAHRGFIDVESKINAGTTFRLYLPVIEKCADETETAAVESQSVRGGTETILLVEDEDSLRRLMKSVLEDNGYRALTAKDGIEAIRLYTEHKDEIALVFTDLGLPGIDGATAIQALRKINPQLKAIFASGFLDLKSRSELPDAQAKAFLEKPYSPNEVLRMIRDVLDRPSR